jgi:hypothetical protein
MIVDKDDNLILADQSFLRMYSKDGKSVKECILGGASWDISYHKKSGRIVVALQNKGIQFVDNFVAQTNVTKFELFWRFRLDRYFLSFHVFKRFKPNCTWFFL